MTINQLWQYSGVILATLVCGWSFLRGGPTERFGAAVVIVGWYLSILLQSHSPKGPGIWVEIIDAVMLLLFLYLSLSTRRLWTILISACQLDTVVFHLAAKVAHYGQYPYVVAIGLWGGYGLLLALAWGVLEHRGRLKRMNGAGHTATTGAGTGAY